MQIHKKYSVVFNHEESEEQQVHAMACYFSNLSYNEHKGDLSGYEIEIDWCGGIKTIFTYCGKLSPEYITELYRETPIKTIDNALILDHARQQCIISDQKKQIDAAFNMLQCGFYMSLDEVKAIGRILDSYCDEYSINSDALRVANRMDDYIKANSISDT